MRLNAHGDIKITQRLVKTLDLDGLFAYGMQGNVSIVSDSFLQALLS